MHRQQQERVRNMNDSQPQQQQQQQPNPYLVRALEEVYNYNHEGVEHMRYGRYEDAIRCCTRGLCLVSQGILTFDDQTDKNGCSIESNENITTTTSGIPLQFLNFQSPSQQNNISKQDKELAGSIHYHPYIYQRPLAIDAHTVECVLVHKVYDRISFILLYNTALANHLHSVATEEVAADDDHHRHERIAGKAISLYSAAVQVLLTAVQNDTYSIEIFMILQNNLGHVHNLLGNTEDAKKCFHEVLGGMACLNPQEVDDGFVINVMPYILQKRNTALAA